MLFIMFDNAMKHSLGSNGEVNATLEVSVARPTLTVAATNSIDPNRDVIGIREALRQIRQEITAQATTARVRAEGGSGLAKIARIGKIDLGAQIAINFDINDTGNFSTTIEITQDRLWA